LYEEDDFLQLSGIQHFAFCRRQWALSYIELQWNENVRTVEGKLFPRAMSQTQECFSPAFGECREGQIPCSLLLGI